MSKAQAIFGFVLGFVSVLPAFPANPDQPYTPTRREWLQTAIYQGVWEMTDFWANRFGALVWVSDDGIYVTVSPADNKTSLSPEATDTMLRGVRQKIEAVVKDYEWARGLPLHIQTK